MYFPGSLQNNFKCNPENNKISLNYYPNCLVILVELNEDNKHSLYSTALKNADMSQSLTSGDCITFYLVEVLHIYYHG